MLLLFWRQRRLSRFTATDEALAMPAPASVQSAALESASTASTPEQMQEQVSGSALLIAATLEDTPLLTEDRRGDSL